LVFMVVSSFGLMPAQAAEGGTCPYNPFSGVPSVRLRCLR